MMRRLIVLALFLTTGCVIERPVREHVTLDFKEPGRVNVIETTTLEEIQGRPPRALGERIESIRDALANGRDDWSNRFNRLAADSERVTVDRKHGQLWRVEHSATIDRDSLQKLVADLPMTIQTTRGDGWSELALYPGASTRATREQREHFEKSIDIWSHAVARYFASMRHLYAYLDEKPQRAKAIFTEILDPPKDAPPLVSNHEQELLDQTGDAASEILTMMDTAEDHPFTLDEEADLVYNPLSADFTVRVPGDVLAVEGFAKGAAGTYRIIAPTLLDAVASLEGRWLTPDPLAIKIRAARVKDAPPPDIDAIAAMKRHAEPLVTPSDIASAVAERLKPPSTYRVRWVE